MLDTKFFLFVERTNDMIDAWELYLGYYIGVLIQTIKGEKPVDLFVSQQSEDRPLVNIS